LLSRPYGKLTKHIHDSLLDEGNKKIPAFVATAIENNDDLPIEAKAPQHIREATAKGHKG
jgi:hypothetical protein